METRIALIGIIVENPDSVEQLNHLLHEYGSFIVGRMPIRQPAFILSVYRPSAKTSTTESLVFVR